MRKRFYVVFRSHCIATLHTSGATRDLLSRIEASVIGVDRIGRSIFVHLKG